MKMSMLLLMITPLFAVANESDPKAVELADKVVAALGGRENYDATRYITWNFFGLRSHTWDKHTGDHRFDNGKGVVVIHNINTKAGNAWENGVAVEDAAKKEEMLKGAYAAWVNDSYWLVMPFKLHDPGVTLAYTREDTLEDGTECHVITLTYEGVGLTPDNKYELYISKADNMPVFWNFFRNYGDEKPSMATPWKGWADYGKIKLPMDFGIRQHKDIAVMDSVPEGTFSAP